MKASELINKLEQAIKDNGDLPVFIEKQYHGPIQYEVTEIHSEKLDEDQFSDEAEEIGKVIFLDGDY